MEFHDAVAVVTGAGRGLGRAHALMLASRGCRVVVNDLGGSVTGGSAVDDKGLRVAVRDELQKLPPSSEPADEVVAEIRRAGGEAVANYDSVEDGAAIVQTALDSFGQIDIVVCNAGIVRTKYFGDYDDNDWHTLMGVHLHGAFTVVRAAWPHFKEQDHGRIVLTGSSAGLYGQNLQAGYGAAKNAMTGLARVLSVEGARYHINVNVVCPAASSRMTDPTNLEVRRGPDSGKALPGGDAMDRMAPEYVSALVTYLCHHSCDSSGCFYHAGGGWYGKVEFIQANGLVLGEDALRDPSLASPEEVARGFDTVGDFDAPGATINGPGNQALGEALARAIAKL